MEENAVHKYTTTYSAENFNNTDKITITNTYVPEEIKGKYNVILRKIDENGKILEGAEFNINDKKYDLSTGEAIILENAEIISEDDIQLTYTIKETKVPEGYWGIDNTTIYVQAKVVNEDNKYIITRVTSGHAEGEGSNTDVLVNLEENNIVISIKNKLVDRYDLALRKFITKVNDKTYSREPIVDTSTIATKQTATYKSEKRAINVKKGDVVTYTIRIYNEGTLDAYAEQITTYLPEHLLPIMAGVENVDEKQYAEEIDFNLNWGWIVAEDGRSATTLKASKANSDTYCLMPGYENVKDTRLAAYVTGSDKLDYIDVEIKCLVSQDAKVGECLTTIAEIAKSQGVNGVEGDKLDSTHANVDYSNLTTYKDEEAMISTKESYIEGQEDDDDFEKIIVRELDLALRKFVTKVNDKQYSREPIVDTTNLGKVVEGKEITTARYNHSKEPVIVETNDIVTYTIRIYNEGILDGFANEIADNIPNGLEFIQSDINTLYKWKMLDKEGNETTDSTKAAVIVTDYLSDSVESNIIRAYTEKEENKDLDYKDVQIQFKVIAQPVNLADNTIKNEAQISGCIDKDTDSVPSRTDKYNYNSNQNEDDIDYDSVKLQYFDLALRKFVTKVNDLDYNNRYPEITFNEDGSITYKQSKDPVIVAVGDTVVYTIRVYNEGEKAGYAYEIKDILPEGLAFDPENEINKEYEWKMLDEEGNITDEAEKVVAFKSEYLKDKEIAPIVRENGTNILNYKDLQIAFFVTDADLSDKIILNIAKITQDSDDDIDSNPDEDDEKEDDFDKEYIKVQYFDLSIKKWVKETQVTLDGKTTTTKTNFDEDSDKIAKVDIVASKLKKTTVKFVYNIKVTNDGETPGYIYEVKDYIPKGLKFIEEENPDWQEVEDNVVATEKLKETLLNPGESAVLEIVLTWKNSSTNLGLKTNYAEISSASSKDIDSVPDNYDFTEDDMDDAQVIISIKTAGAKTYIGLVFVAVAILAGGVFLIKKYVLD